MIIKVLQMEKLENSNFSYLFNSETITDMLCPSMQISKYP
jgi:hypothetical protein